MTTAAVVLGTTPGLFFLGFALHGIIYIPEIFGTRFVEKVIPDCLGTLQKKTKKKNHKLRKIRSYLLNNLICYHNPQQWTGK